MGKQMASNLMKRGYTMTVYNRSKKSVDELQSIGAGVASSPKEVASKSDIVIDMVTDAPDVEQVLFDDNGVIAGARPGRLLSTWYKLPRDSSLHSFQIGRETGRIS